MNEQAKSKERVIEGCCEGAFRDWTSRADASGACPMMGMCARFAGRAPMGLFLAIAGIILIGLGVFLLVEPRVLIWLIAGAVIVMGVAAMVGAVAARRWRAGPARP